MTPVLLIAAAGCAVIAVILIVLAMRKGKLRSDIAATETTPVAHVRELDRVELKGAAQSNTPLEAPYCKTPCVYYQFTLKQRERRHTTSSKGPRYHWRVLDSGSNHIPFTLVDDTGAILVQPEGAAFEPQKLAGQYVQPGHSDALQTMEEGTVKTLVTAAAALGAMTIRQKIEVYGIPANQPVYVLGHAQRDPQGQLVIQQGGDKLLISAHSEETLLRRYTRQLIGFYAAAILFAAAAIGLLIYAATATG